MDEWTHEFINLWMDPWMNSWMDPWMDPWMNPWTEPGHHVRSGGSEIEDIALFGSEIPTMTTARI